MPAELDLLLRARYPLVWLDTAEEERAVELICATARAMGDPVAGWSLTWGLHDLPGAPRTGQHADPLKLLEHMRSEQRRHLWVLLDLGGLTQGNTPLVRALRDTARVLRELGSVIVVVGPGHAIPAELLGTAALHRLALPDQADHERLLRTVATQLKIQVAPEAARALSTACLGLTLEQAENIWARVRAAGGRFTAADVGQLIAEKARIVRGSGYLEFVAAAGIGDVGGLDGLKSWMRQRALGFSPEARAQGLPWPRGALLVGVQGCGKSLTAKAVAGLWNQPLLRLDVGALMEGLVGASERNLRHALDLAGRIAPCVLWIDEIEKGFRGLEHSTDGGTIARMFGTMLTWMQEKDEPVFVLATANQIDVLPPEMLRKGRFDEIFFVDLPDLAQRAEIWGIHLGYRARLGGDALLLERMDLAALGQASEGYSGAEIAAAVVEGAFAALAGDEHLQTRHLLTALSASPPLSRTRVEEVDRLRAWAQGRARRAG
ncbi:MAG: AAA family ATPase [Pseudomonadota bacterium]